MRLPLFDGAAGLRQESVTVVQLSYAPQYQNEAKPQMGACRSLSIPTLTSWLHRAHTNGGSTTTHHRSTAPASSSPSSPHNHSHLDPFAFQHSALDSSIGHRSSTPHCTFDFAGCFSVSSTQSPALGHPPTDWGYSHNSHHCASDSTASTATEKKHAESH